MGMDVVDLDRRAAAGMATVLASTARHQYGAPTPCPAWTVRDLIAHVLAGVAKYREIAAGGNWARGAPEIDLPDDPVSVYRPSVEAMLHAWAQTGVLDREIDLPLGRGRAEAALYIHLGETLVHAWDLARATGQKLTLEPAVAEASLAQFMTWLAPKRPEGTPFADARSLDGDATAIDRLAAYLGRDVQAWPG